MIRRLLSIVSPRWRWRSAITGQFVSRLYALAHPRTTVKERP